MTLFYKEQYEASRGCLTVGEELARSMIDCRSLLVWCLYFQAKILCKDGQFDRALAQVLAAADAGAGVITEAECATLDLFQAWLLFLLKKPTAKAVLKRADDVLRRTDCHLRRGDVLSARGRLALADGDFKRAQRLFMRAINSYAHDDSMHPHAARARVNSATALLRHLKSQSITGRQRVDLCQQARTQLDQAEAIYRSDDRHDMRKLAKVFLVRASMYQAVGELVAACAQIERALDIALALDNNVLMAEAKRLQAECSDDPAERIDLAKQADSYAKQTDDQRLHDRTEQSLRQAQEP